MSLRHRLGPAEISHPHWTALRVSGEEEAQPHTAARDEPEFQGAKRPQTPTREPVTSQSACAEFQQGGAQTAEMKHKPCLPLGAGPLQRKDCVHCAQKAAASWLRGGASGAQKPTETQKLRLVHQGPIVLTS